VANVAPTLTAPPNQTSDEGESKAFQLGSFADPGPDGPWQVAVHWGDGSDPDSFEANAPGSLGTLAHTYADDGEYTVTVRVTEEGGDAQPYGEATFTATVANLPPRVDLRGPDTVEEGDAETYTFTVSDPGANDTWGFADGYPRCGQYGQLVDGSLEQTATGGSFDCFFPDGGSADDPTITRVAVKVVDDGGAESVAAVDKVDVIDVHVTNVAPDVTAAGNQAADEGESKLFALGSFADPGPDAPWTVDVYWGDGSPKTTFAAAEKGAIAAQPHAYGDNGSYIVTVKVTDKNGGRGSATFTVEVANVAPTASNGSFVFDPILGQATASFLFRDVGWLDTHAGSYFRWSVDGGAPRSAAVSETNSPPAAEGTASDTRRLASGCMNLTVVGVAKDDEGAESNEVTIVANQQTSVHASGFRPPIADNQRNVAKYGNVVPVKVAIVDSCTGASVTNVDLYITLAKGTGSEAVEDTNLVAESVSAADSGTKMRVADGMHIYNLSTRGLTANTDYTVRVRLGSTSGPILLAAVLHPKK
jgi:hypothetical protein